MRKLALFQVNDGQYERFPEDSWRRIVRLLAVPIDSIQHHLARCTRKTKERGWPSLIGTLKSRSK